MVAKIQSARALNNLFARVVGGEGSALDQRSLRRKKRLMRELADGRGGKPLKALQVLTHADELLALGESLSSLRKLKPRMPGPAPRSMEADAVYAEAQKLYRFDPKAWRLLGVDIQRITRGQR